MASIWVKLKTLPLRRMRSAKIIAPFLLLGITYVVYRSLSSLSSQNKFGIVRVSKSNQDEQPMSPKEINRHIGMMDDTRPSHCSNNDYNKVLNNEFYQKVSIIMDYKDEEFYDLKLALSALFTFTPNHQFSEVIIIDDGTRLTHVKQQAAEYFKEMTYSNVKVFRSEKSEGQSVSRFKGSRMATGSTLVFLGSKVVINQGWLQPLLAKVKEEPSTIAVPHHDNFLPGHRFYPLDNGLINVPTWSFSIVHMETSGQIGEVIDSPMMRGDAFAISRNFLMKLGDFDESLNEGGGHNFELTLRAWLCGGKVQTLLCSRVAVLSALRPLEVTTAHNFHYIAEMWLDAYKPVAYKQRGLKEAPPKAILDNVIARKAYLKNTLKKCQSFDWYLQNIAKDLIMPSQNAMLFGKIKSGTSLCMKSPSKTSTVIEMELCRPHIYDSMFLFEMDTSGLIKMGDRCLILNPKRYAAIDQCELYKTDRMRTWTMDSKGKIMNRNFRGLCLTQVSERGQNNELQHFLMLMECSSAELRTQTFTILPY